MTVAGLRESLLPGRRFVLDGPPGSGKTTTLVHLAESEGECPGIPLLVNLPEWIDAGSGILDFLAARQQFRGAGIDADALSRVAQLEHIAFLLNGWNEVSASQSERAATRLEGLVRDFPQAAIVIASRIRTPLPGVTNLRLQRLNAVQRLQYLDVLFEENRAEEIASTLREDHVLNELTSTPFVLAEIARVLQSGGQIPRTRMALLRNVVDLLEREDERRPHLQATPLNGCAEDYLRALAMELTRRGEALCGEKEARKICSLVSDRLRVSGEICGVPDSKAVLDILCSYHLLDRLDDSGARYRFSHQQFQEFYAATALVGGLSATAASGDPARRDDFIRSYVNEPAWDEAIRMLAEQFGDEAREPTRSEFLVRAALRVDPVFAAELARLCGASLGSEARQELAKCLRAWHGSSSATHRSCALAGMVATGSDEFADIVIPMLASPDQEVRAAPSFTGVRFHLSSLGSNWRTVIEQWPEQWRIEFVTDLAIRHGDSTVALELARTDPSQAVRIEALFALSWVGEHRVVSEILGSAPGPEFVVALQKLEPEFLPSSVRPRAIECLRSLLVDTAIPRRRFEIALALDKLGDDDVPALLKAELDTCSPDAVAGIGEPSLQSGIDIVRRSDPQWVDGWIIGQLSAGTLTGERWVSLVSHVPHALTAQCLKRISTETVPPRVLGGIVDFLTAAVDPPLARAVFDELCNCRRKVDNGTRTPESQETDWQLTCVFKALPLLVVVQGLEDVLQSPAELPGLSVVLDLFGALGSESRDARGALDNEQCQRLRRYLKASIPRAVGGGNVRSEDNVRLALALGSIGEPEDTDDLCTLIRADIERAERWRAASARGDRSVGNPTSWAMWYVRALAKLGWRTAQPVLLSLLENPDYELAAACALRVLAQRNADGAYIGYGQGSRPHRDYRAIGVGAPRETALDEARRRRYSSAVRQRISTLLDERRLGAIDARQHPRRIKELALLLADLDPAGSDDFILDIAEMPAARDAYLRVDLVEALAFGCTTVPTARVLGILDPVIAEIRSHRVGGSDASLLHQLLRVLPLLDDPASGIARVRDLQSEFRLPLLTNAGLLMALARCGSEDGVTLLRDLTKLDRRLFQDHAEKWITAVSSSQLPSAKSLLMAFLDPSECPDFEDVELPDYAVRQLGRSLADLARQDDVVSRRILDLCGQPTSPKRRRLLATTVVAIGTTGSLDAGLDLIDDESPEPLPFEFWKGIEEAFVERLALEDRSHICHLRPRTANSIRARLFETSLGDPRRSRSAYDLLGQIEHWRLESGRPAYEPRHPAYESGSTWPILAADGGAAISPSLLCATGEIGGESSIPETPSSIPLAAAAPSDDAFAGRGAGPQSDGEVQARIPRTPDAQGRLERRKANGPVRRNPNYEKIDGALRAIAESCPRTQDEILTLLDGRCKVFPPAEPFVTARGWMAGFRRDKTAARAWLSKRWRGLNLPPLPRGPKNPRK